MAGGTYHEVTIKWNVSIFKSQISVSHFVVLPEMYQLLY